MFTITFAIRRHRAGTWTPRGAAFWPEHMPVLFFGYAGQGILAGLIAYAYAVGGPLLLVVLLAAALGAYWLHRLYRRVEAVLEWVLTRHVAPGNQTTCSAAACSRS